MPLTPEDVSNKRFTPVRLSEGYEMGEVVPPTPEYVISKRFTPFRLREGYDMGEVDQFLDEVEAELARLTAENDELRAKLAAAQSGSPSFEPAPTQLTAVQEAP